jgi:hypothetical protein
MKYLGTGVKYGSWERLLNDLEVGALAGRALEALSAQSEGLKRLRAIHKETTFRGEKRRRVLDRGDPRAAGWTFLIHADDPDRDAIVRAMRPLAEHRGMRDPGKPMLFGGEPPSRWNDWLMIHHSRISPHREPEYILIVGGPDRIPFQFQAFLDIPTSCGRLDFDDVAELDAYVAKLLRLERAPEPAPACRAVVFAPDGGPLDPTHYSRAWMAEPLAAFMQDSGVPVVGLFGADATGELLRSSARLRPALVYMASHGVFAPREEAALQAQVNGAIHCAGTARPFFGAADVPAADAPLAAVEPFFEGSVFFAFACFSAGTPAESDFAHWAGGPAICAARDFTAALPKRLLAHPRGPVGFVGHVDAAFLAGFDDLDLPAVEGAWGARMGPFVSAVSSLLDVQPVGLALSAMNARHASTSIHLVHLLERLERGLSVRTPELDDDLARHFVLRSDARNFLVLGDPAARVRMPALPGAPPSRR